MVEEVLVCSQVNKVRADPKYALQGFRAKPR